MASFQDKLARSIFAMQNRLFDFNVEIQGTETISILLNIIVDKYGDREQTIEKSNPLHTIWDFVEDEIPTSMNSSYDNNSQSNSQVIHMYDLVPISVYFKNQEIKNLNIKNGSIILYKLKLMDETFQVIPFQITDCVSKGNFASGILWSQYTVSNNIGYDLNNNEDFKAIIEEFKNYDLW